MALLGTVIGRGVVGSRPAAGTAGAMYYGTDTLRWYRDNGSSWDDASGNPMTTAGDLIYGGSSGLPTRLAAGASKTLLQGGTVPAWVTGSQVLFVQTADATLTANTAETTILGTGVGSKTLAANALIAGSTLRIKAYGYYTVTATGDTGARLKVKFGSTIILDSGAAALVPNNVDTNEHWELDAVITCRTTGGTGTVMAQGKVLWKRDLNSSGFETDAWKLQSTATVTIDTTTTNVMDVTFDWPSSSANYSITTTNATIEQLG